MYADVYADLCESSSSEGDSSSISSADVPSDDIVDAFPSRIFTKDNYADLRHSFFFAASAETLKPLLRDAVPIVMYKRRSYLDVEENVSYERIVFKNLAEDRDILADRFTRLLDDAAKLDPRTGNEDVQWPLLENKFLKSPRMTHREAKGEKINKTDGEKRRGNADNRLAFCWKDLFLTKQHFTFGLRTAGPDEFHLIRILKIPILFYRLKRSVSMNGHSNGEGSFYSSRKNQFDAFLLRAMEACVPTIYVVYPGTSYVLLTLQKTFFAINRCTVSVIEMLKNENWALFEADNEVNRFRPMTAEEFRRFLETGDASLKTGKRGRPKKSLDELYWDHQPPSSQPPSKYLKTPCGTSDPSSSVNTTTSSSSGSNASVPLRNLKEKEEYSPSTTIKAQSSKTELGKSASLNMPNQDEINNFIHEFFHPEVILQEGNVPNEQFILPSTPVFNDVLFN